MPLFEYRCPACKVDFEILVRAGERPACPTCGELALEKLLSAAAVSTAARGGALDIASNCPPPDAPPCGPGCCRLM